MKGNTHSEKLDIEIHRERRQRIKSALIGIIATTGKQLSEYKVSQSQQSNYH